MYCKVGSPFFNEHHKKFWYWLILPTPAIRDKVVSYLIKKHPDMNYRVDWLDTNGYGLQLTRCEWVHKGLYHNK